MVWKETKRRTKMTDTQGLVNIIQELSDSDKKMAASTEMKRLLTTKEG